MLHNLRFVFYAYEYDDTYKWRNLVDDC